MITSLEIAEKTGRRHANVMQTIKKTFQRSEYQSQLQLKLAKYTDKQGKKRPVYKLEAKALLFVARHFDPIAEMQLVEWALSEMYPFISPRG